MPTPPFLRLRRIRIFRFTKFVNMKTANWHFSSNANPAP